MIHQILENNRLDRLRFFLLDFITKNIGLYPNAEPAEHIIANALNGLNVGKMNALSDVIYNDSDTLKGLSIKTLKKLTPIKKRTRMGKDNKVYFEGWWAPKSQYAIERRCQLINVSPHTNTPEECGEELLNNFHTFEKQSNKILASKFQASDDVNSLLMLYGLQEQTTYWEYAFLLYAEPYKIHDDVKMWKFKANGRELDGYGADGKVLYSWDSVSTRCLKKYNLSNEYVFFTLRVDKPDVNVTDEHIQRVLAGQSLPLYNHS